MTISTHGNGRSPCASFKFARRSNHGDNLTRLANYLDPDYSFLTCYKFTSGKKSKMYRVAAPAESLDAE
jgi:hypothetical protein